MPEANKQLFAHLMEQVFNRGNLETADDLVAADFVNHEAPQVRGPEGFKSTARWLRGCFPDLHADLHEVVAEGDLVVARIVLSGTHRGEPYLGAAPSGRSFSVQHIHMYRVVGNRLAEHWACRDDLGQLIQLGLFPPPVEPV